jgi:hypothetical protein
LFQTAKNHMCEIRKRKDLVKSFIQHSPLSSALGLSL